MAITDEPYDDAMFLFSQGRYAESVDALRAILSETPDHFDAQLALGMALYRLERYAEAIEEGHRAEKLRPKEQLVHTNLSLFYMKAGDKQTAEHHGLQARIAGWRQDDATGPEDSSDPELRMAAPPPKPVKLPGKFPDMPWKKKDSKPLS